MTTLPQPRLELIYNENEIDFGLEGSEKYGKPASLYELQENIALAALEHFNKGERRVGICSPTGTGKTEIGINLIDRVKNVFMPKPEDFEDLTAFLMAAGQQESKTTCVVWLTDKIELNTQSGKRLRARGKSVFNLTPKTFPSRYARTRAPQSFGVDVIICSPQMFNSRFDPNMFTEYDLMIVDETHHTPATSWKRAVMNWPGIRIGLSATWWRMNDREGFPEWDVLVQKHHPMDFVDSGVLTPIDYVGAPADLWIKGQGLHMGEYKNYVVAGGNHLRFCDRIADYLIEARDKDLAKFGKIRRTVIFSATSEHARDTAMFLNDKLTAMGLPGKVGLLLSDVEGKNKGSRWATTKWDSEDFDDMLETERDRIVADFESGELEYIVNLNMLTEGFDCKGASRIVQARSTKSLVIFLQQNGRGTRPDPDFPYCEVVDFAGNISEHGHPYSARLYSLRPRNEEPPTRPPITKTCPQCSENNLPGALTVCTFCGYHFGQVCHGPCGKFVFWKHWSLGNPKECDMCIMGRRNKMVMVSSLDAAAKELPTMALRVDFREGMDEFVITWREAVPEQRFAGGNVFAREVFRKYKDLFLDPKVKDFNQRWVMTPPEVAGEIPNYPRFIDAELSDTQVEDLYLEGAIQRPIDCGLLSDEQIEAVENDTVHELPGALERARQIAINAELKAEREALTSERHRHEQRFYNPWNITLPEIRDELDDGREQVIWALHACWAVKKTQNSYPAPEVEPEIDFEEVFENELDDFLAEFDEPEEPKYVPPITLDQFSNIGWKETQKSKASGNRNGFSRMTPEFGMMVWIQYFGTKGWVWGVFAKGGNEDTAKRIQNEVTRVYAWDTSDEAIESCYGMLTGFHEAGLL